MNYLSTISKELPSYSDSEFYSSQEKLQKNMKQKSFYREQQFSIQKGANISTDYTNENQRRSYFWECKLSKANLTNTGMSGSIFKSVHFENCIINNTKLDSCDFEDCHFAASKNTNEFVFYNPNFSKSTFINTRFIDCEMIGANFSDAIFIDSVFKKNVWKSLCLENCVFKNTIFDSIELVKLNFEYSSFESIKMNNVRLPFPTIPYIYKGLEYLMGTDDLVFISSADSKNGKISITEYLSYLHDLEVFYSKTQNYFPLANIYIAQKQWDKAYSSIILGINVSIQLHSYRTVYYFCKLLQMYKEFSTEQCVNANRMITNFIGNNGYIQQDTYKLDRYIEPIRNLLLNENKTPTLSIDLLTNIDSSEYVKLSTLLSSVDSIVQYVNESFSTKVEYYVEVRHYCPFSTFFKFFGDYPSLIMISGIVYFVLTGIELLYNKVIKAHQNYLEDRIKKEQLEGVKLDNQLKMKEIEEKSIEIEIKKQQLERWSEGEETKTFLKEKHQTIQNNNILIINGNHNLSNYYSDDNGINYFEY